MIIVLPAIIIVPQPDPGSALIYSAFVFTMYREGMHPIFLLLGFFAAALFVGTLAFGVPWVVLIVLCIVLAVFLKNRKKKKKRVSNYVFVFALCAGFAFSVNYIFNNVFEQRHRDRFNIVLGKSEDVKGIGYNTNQSEIAIGSGGWLGKGWTEGTQTKGDFVPEQHTDCLLYTSPSPRD